ncbi:MAG TPA: hypothetical protein VMX16_18675 [Terriglobia bacterium]|nr:hypothetical protein [Terriglobia bacterium]
MPQPKELPALIHDANEKVSAFFARWREAPQGGQSSLLLLLKQVPEVFAALEAVGDATDPETLDNSGLSAADQESVDTYSANLKRFRQFLAELEPMLGRRRDHMAAEGSRLRDTKSRSNTLKMTR